MDDGARRAGRPARRRRRRDPPHGRRRPRARGLHGRAAPRAAARRWRRPSACSPAVVLLDLSMPDLDGLEVLRRLRERRRPGAGLRALGARRGRRPRRAGCRRAPTTTSSSRSRMRGGRRAAARAAAPAPGGRGRGARGRRPAPRPARAQRAARRARRSTSRAASSSCSSSSCAIPARSLERARLHEEVWGYTFDPGTNVADVFVGYLRRKLEAGGEPRVLHTVRGVGFVLRSLNGRCAAFVVASRSASRSSSPPSCVAAGAVASHYVDSSERAALDDRLERTAELSRPTALAAVNDELPAERHAPRRRPARRPARRCASSLGRHGPARHRRAAARSARACSAGCRPSRRDGQRYRAYVTTLRDPGLGGLARLEIVTPLASLEHRQARARPPAARPRPRRAAGRPAPACGWRADLVLRPLRRLRTVASSVAEDEDLDRRVPPATARPSCARWPRASTRCSRASGARRPTATRALAATRRFAADAGPRAAHAADQRAGDAVDARAPPRPPARAPRGDARRRAGRAAPARRAPRRPAGAGPRRRRAARVHRGRPRRGRRRGRRPPPSSAIRASTSAPSCPMTPVAVEGWEPGLRLLVDNLVENAVRHGRPHGHVRVTLDAPPDGEDGGAVLTVDDDGPGIPDADRERIFAPFARLDVDQRRGLGPRPRPRRSSRSATTARGSTSASRRSAARASASASRRARRHRPRQPRSGLYNLDSPGARSSVGERSLHTREVAGSKPAAPTS